MSRAIWKGLYISNFIRYILYFNIEKNIFIKKGNIKIFNKLVNYTFFLYNGKKFIEIVIQNNYINFFLGQFVFSRKIDVIHKKNKKKKCHH